MRIDPQEGRFGELIYVLNMVVGLLMADGCVVRSKGYRSVKRKGSYGFHVKMDDVLRSRLDSAANLLRVRRIDIIRLSLVKFLLEIGVMRVDGSMGEVDPGAVDFSLLVDEVASGSKVPRVTISETGNLYFNGICGKEYMSGFKFVEVFWYKETGEMEIRPVIYETRWLIRRFGMSTACFINSKETLDEWGFNYHRTRTYPVNWDENRCSIIVRPE